MGQKYRRVLTAAILLLSMGCGLASGQGKTSKAKKRLEPGAWSFAVSGDSRNCGNVVMPAVAAGAKKDGAAFYWHLGDLRSIRVPDEDYLHEPEHRGHNHLIQSQDELAEYRKDSWDDFVRNQISVFHPIPVFMGIGNHETNPPKSRAEFVARFADWLDAAPLKQQRLADSPQDYSIRTYYHWIQGGVDFIYLDNATWDQFDAEQMRWFEKTLQQVAAVNPEVRAVVVAMHAALPESVVRDHSMSEWAAGATSGRQVYTDLLDFQRQTGKPVYLLASHSHFYMTDVYDTDYWRSHGGVLPGWIVGTGGAYRYPLPSGLRRDKTSQTKTARTKAYGYLLATVQPAGVIRFTFREVKRQDVPRAVQQTYTPEFVGWCFARNADPRLLLKSPAQ